MLWQQIRINKRNSILLMASMAAVLAALGYLLGVVWGGSPNTGWMGLMVATVIWLILAAISFSAGDQILLASSQAVPVSPSVNPQLFNVVEEMALAANLPKLPKIYIINDPAPNAFATGRSPETASVAVTAGLLGRLNRDELQGVIAHEISHIVHRDILYVTLAGIMLGAIALLSQILWRSMYFGTFHSRRYSSRSGGQVAGAQVVLMALALILAFLAPLFAQLLYFALSRRREFLADAGAVRLTRYPEGLASALEKIAGYPVSMETANAITAPMYIVNPFRGIKAAHLFSTHPPIEQRIRILRQMAHGIGYKEYQQAYQKVTGKSGLIPAAALTDEPAVAPRSAADSQRIDPKTAQRRTGDLMRRVNGFVFVDCACGVRLKVPPTLAGKTIQCPRCGLSHAV